MSLFLYFLLQQTKAEGSTCESHIQVTLHSCCGRLLLDSVDQYSADIRSESLLKLLWREMFSPEDGDPSPPPLPLPGNCSEQQLPAAADTVSQHLCQLMGVEVRGVPPPCDEQCAVNCISHESPGITGVTRGPHGPGGVLWNSCTWLDCSSSSTDWCSHLSSLRQQKRHHFHFSAEEGKIKKTNNYHQVVYWFMKSKQSNFS